MKHLLFGLLLMSLQANAQEESFDFNPNPLQVELIQMYTDGIKGVEERIALGRLDKEKAYEDMRSSMEQLRLCAYFRAAQYKLATENNLGDQARNVAATQGQQTYGHMIYLATAFENVYGKQAATAEDVHKDYSENVEERVNDVLNLKPETITTMFNGCNRLTQGLQQLDNQAFRRMERNADKETSETES